MNNPQRWSRPVGILEQYNELRSAVEMIESDMQKCAGGNKAAGVRVRKEMQRIRELAQEIRKGVLDSREGPEPAKG